MDSDDTAIAQNSLSGTDDDSAKRRTSPGMRNSAYNRMLTNHALIRNLYYDGKRLPYNPGLLPYARALRKNATREEQLLWRYLRRLPVRVYRQHPIDHYIVDFYFPSKRLAVEIDGGQHYTEPGKTYDAERTKILMQLGLNVIRFTNLDVRQNLDLVCMQIWRELRLK